MPALNRVLTHTPLTPDELAEADEVAQFYFDYIGEIIDSKRGKLGPEDPVGALMLAEEEGGRLSRDELIVTLVGFFIASYHTTMTAMTNAVHALLSHPDQMRLLAADPDLAPHGHGRRCCAGSRRCTSSPGTPAYEFELHGETIAEGTQLLLGIASANRDERRFPDPDTFDIRRADKRHLAFTAGGHYCLGAPLSRLEGDILLRLLPQRLPAMALIDTNTPRTDDLVFPVMTALMVAPKGV